jgi:MYXO-CTERM domain-containing protein
VAAGGLEEWLLLEAGIARAGRVVASWDIEGATLRQKGEVVEVLDSDGAARIWITAPAAFTVSGRSVTAELSAHRTRLDLSVDAAGEAVLVDPAWLPAVGMGSARTGHTATMLDNGLVLVVGGSNNSIDTSTAELYNPMTFTWSPAPPMSAGRRYPTATVLPDKRVLIAGGTNANVQIYDPQSNAWTQAASMNASRMLHVAVLLEDGTVLVAGGTPTHVNSAIASAEVYDPVANTWTPVAPLSVARSAPDAVRLDNGQVLVAGGSDGSFPSWVAVNSVEKYNPATKSWVPAAPMVAPRAFFRATRLVDGKILATGGRVHNQQSLVTAEIYDQQADTWTLVNPMSYGHYLHTATVLPSNMVLVVGGETENSEIFDPVTKTWTPGGALVSGATIENTATLLPNGSVMLTGGTKLPAGFASNEVEIWSSSALGVGCVTAADCASGFCSDGVCCNGACNDACEACSVAAGAPANGTCSPTTGNSCDDGSACTQNDICQNGVCAAGNAVVCPAAGPCQVPGACDPQTGACSAAAPKPDGAACNDNNPCSQTDKCQGGVCVGQNPIVCAPIDECNEAGACDPATGLCSSVPKANGSPCNDGDACTQTDTCQAGFCTGNNLVACPAIDACHVAGSCDPQTGLCSSPPGNNGSLCDDGNACTTADICQNGACVGDTTTPCEASDQCHEAGTCDPQTGACSNPPKPNGTPCEKGACSEGVCQPKGSPTSSSSGTGAGGEGNGGAGSGGSGGAGGRDKDDPGCGCSTPGSDAPNGGYLALLGLLLLVRPKRRRAATDQPTA